MGISPYSEGEASEKIMERREIWEFGRPNEGVSLRKEGAPEKTIQKTKIWRFLRKITYFVEVVPLLRITHEGKDVEAQTVTKNY